MAGSLGPLPPGRPRGDVLAAVAAGLVGVPEGAAVVVGISGGSDSTALAYLVAEAREDLALHLVHVRHGLRDDAAEQPVLDLHAAYLGLPLRRVEVEVVPAGEGVEAAARQVRYEALAATAADVGATFVVVGHTADDQAETVLLRAARGTGTDGLGAMPRDRDLDGRARLLRPLLRLRREALREFLAAEGLPFVDDPTNTAPEVRRSVVRNVVLPALGQVGGDPVGALGRLAELSRADAAALDDMAATAAAEMLVRVGPVRCLPDDRLDALPLALRRRIVRAVLGELLDRPLGADAVDRVLTLANGAAVDLAGAVRATAGGGWRTIGPPTEAVTPASGLSVPGEVAWPPIGARIVAITPRTGTTDAAEAGQIAFELAEAWTPPAVRVPPHLLPPGGVAERMSLAVGPAHHHLEVRHRRPGDRLRTGGGTRRLQDVLVDAGLPRPVRDLWPIVAVGDRVVWVPGIAADVETVQAGRAAPRALLVVQAAV
ncbi:MAG TPA: tRNA lysidine(34) synthetase TilS [Egicoccus sp.]|nr:tRNA lysidine(34) synthetase TilS [Egicoccus sp.]HSK24755.1 tRNA lysidine(34) synthetase TilS [Egicoccus sp.]